jgi:hypothetical protein
MLDHYYGILKESEAASSGEFELKRERTSKKNPHFREG